jgi:peptide/nickel transport system ATP-binding protein
MLKMPEETTRTRVSEQLDKAAPDLPILKVEHLTQRFRVRGRDLEAVSDVSFQVNRGETFGLVGESGCGKSSIGRAILQLPRPTSGSVQIEGLELTTLPSRDLRSIRRRMQVVFQDPVSAFNPRRQVGEIVAEGLVIAGVPKATRLSRVHEALSMVGLDPDEVAERRPHQLSGGQNQRVAIARALVLNPDLLICDEPVASLDVSVQGQVLNLLDSMRTRFGLSMLFISHDLSVVHNVCDRIAVLYLGKIVELGDSDVVSRHPAHPYSKALSDAIPPADPDAPTVSSALKGEVPSPLNPPSGCRFRTRCPIAKENCATDTPSLREVGENHLVACHYPLT